MARPQAQGGAMGATDGMAPRASGAVLSLEQRPTHISQCLAFKRYCHCQYCMVYGIHEGGRVGVVYCALVVQWYCNSVSDADGGGNKRMID